MTEREEGNGGDAALGNANDALREAGDPTTPGARLEALWQREGDMAVRRVAMVALRNPSFPLASLSSLLLQPERSGRIYDVSAHLQAWYNPSVPLLLMHEPLREYEKAALRLLWTVSDAEGGRVLRQVDSLAHAIVWWSTMLTPPRSVARDFARHLAGLFGLPWPEEEP